MKKLFSEFWKCIRVIFQLGHYFSHLSFQWLFVLLFFLFRIFFVLHRDQLKFGMHHYTDSVSRINYLWTCEVIV